MLHLILVLPWDFCTTKSRYTPKVVLSAVVPLLLLLLESNSIKHCRSRAVVVAKSQTEHFFGLWGLKIVVNLKVGAP